MIAIINTYNKITPRIIIYETLIKMNSISTYQVKQVTMYVQDSDYLTSDIKKAHIFKNKKDVDIVIQKLLLTFKTYINIIRKETSSKETPYKEISHEIKISEDRSIFIYTKNI